MPKQIKRLFAFDFDDTLAVTTSIIGVRRIKPDGKSDPEFINWILDNNLDFQDIEGKDTDSEIFWFESGDYAKYETAHQNDLEYLTLNELTDEFDFSKTAGVDLDSTTPIDSILGIMQQAYGDPESEVVVITARSGAGELPSLSGIPKKATNIKDIQNFLKSQGVNLSSNHVSTAGDIGGSPGAKAQIMMGYIEFYNPEYVYFYDDNAGNVAAISQLCDELYPEIKIKTFQLGDNGDISGVGGCYE